MKVKYHKEFDINLYEENDPKSTATVLKWLRKQGLPFIKNPNPYEIDLICEPLGIGIELERRTIFITESFPYESIHLLHRKIKYFSGEGNKNIFCVIGKEYDRILTIRGFELQPYISEEKLKNMMVWNNEKKCKELDSVYDIPVKLFKNIQLN